MLRAVNYLHSEGVIHRDLKPENIVLNEYKCPENLKIIDFGSSIFKPLDQKSVYQQNIGTCYYMAPEIIEAESHNEKVDLWSIGVITYFLLSGNVPFYGEEISDI